MERNGFWRDGISVGHCITRNFHRPRRHENGDYTLAVSDVFGGNAFLPMLFLPATLLSGQSILPQAQKTDIYLASLGALLTAIYMYGLIFRPKRQFFLLGIDSILVLLVYILGIIGLFTIPTAH